MNHTPTKSDAAKAWAAIKELGAMKLEQRQKFGWENKMTLAICHDANTEIDRHLKTMQDYEYSTWR